MLTYDTPATSHDMVYLYEAVTKYRISVINSCWEKCAYMFNVYKNQLCRQTGSRNLMIPKTLPMIWLTYVKLVTKYQISATNSCWEKCDEKHFGRTDGQRLNNIPSSPLGSKSVDLILIRLAKWWNTFFPSKFCIWLYCENVKSEYFFFSPVQPNFFLQDSESKYLFRKKPYKNKIE